MIYDFFACTDMMHRFISIITSLRLTVACLVAALILVFVGTLAQVDLGLYAAQAKFFRSFFVYWTPGGGRLEHSRFPRRLAHRAGACWSICSAAHVKRFKFDAEEIWHPPCSQPA